MDDWEDAVFSSRHMHNRVGGHAGKSKAGDKSYGGGGGAFDVRKSFGTYEVKLGKNKKASASTLEILRLTADGEGVIGDLHLEGVMMATVLMTGSRKALNRVIDGLGDTNEAPDAVPDSAVCLGDGDEDGNGSQADDDDSIGSKNPGDAANNDLEIDTECQPLEEKQQGRFETFEKNSFRSPKFWLRFQGHDHQTDDVAHRYGTGYLVFSSKDCRKFEGTISCDAINWDNKKISGWKTMARSERDTLMLWHDQVVA
ncbi:catalase [Apiospora saccharicola]|uniref:Catalase n=1 Tax=Apiospora saccharicola TaxID=335842 RepID=A0ABR1TMI2_9PEZI